MPKKTINVSRTIQAMFDKMERAPSFAYNIPDVKKFKAHCRASQKNLKAMAKFVGVEVVYR